MTQRVSSIRTRIKTIAIAIPLFRNYLREYLPLEQGLRLLNELPADSNEALREYLPLEQGLRHQYQ